MNDKNLLKVMLKKNELFKDTIKNQLTYKSIKEIINDYKKTFKEHEVEFISNSFNYFLKNIKIYPLTHSLVSNEENIAMVSFMNSIESHKSDTIIFELKDNELNENIELKDIIIPFSNFFIATDIKFELDDDLIGSEGFFVKDLEEFSKDYLLVGYFWSRCINDGWAFNSFMVKKNSISLKDGFVTNNFNEIKDEFIKKIQFIMSKKFYYLIKTLLQSISKKEYTSYKQWTPSGIVTKNIVYSYDVKTHRRHFWIDSGRFKIPLMSKEELENKGYGIDELVFRDGELRRDVPFRIIGQFKVDGKKEQKDNRIIILFEKRVLRQEGKLLKVLREIFPNEIIRKHDRKVLYGLELDFLIYNKRIAFEYDGEQHFDKLLYNKLYGSGFEEQQKRDRLKDKLCVKRNIKLIRIKYNDRITKSNILRKLIN